MRFRASWLLPSRRYGAVDSPGLAQSWGQAHHLPSSHELLPMCPQVTQPGAGVVLTLAGLEPGELAPSELEMLSRNLMGTLSRLARERDLGAQVRLGGSRDIVDPDIGGRWRFEAQVWDWGLGPQLSGSSQPDSS